METLKVPRKKQCCDGWWNTQVQLCPDVREGEIRTPFWRLHDRRQHQGLVPHGEKVLARHIMTLSLDRLERETTAKNVPLARQKKCSGLGNANNWSTGTDGTR